METRPANIEGKGEVTQRDLVRNSLRMRPDRIIVGEVRGGEVLDMLQAMNTGHDGSLSTIHANSPRDALMRLETLVAMSGLNIPALSVKRYISSALNVIIHLSRLVDGTRKVTSIQEVSGMEGETVTLQEIFYFEQTGVDSQGLVKGRFRARGVRPRFVEKFKAMGIQVPPTLFDSDKIYEV
jgi:pilus assembly protein CpaF